MSTSNSNIPALPQSDLLYLNGPFAPIREEVTAFDLSVTGTIPQGLNGRLLRVGSNPYTIDDVDKYHWFAGTGMVHGIRLSEGRAAWYRNRYLIDDQVAALRARQPVPGARTAHYGQAWLDHNLNNTSAISLAGKVLAISEGGVIPIVLDDEELSTVGTESFNGTFPGAFTGHPHVDPDTGEMHAIGYYWEWDHVKYMTLDVEGKVRRVVDVPAPNRPIVHDFVMTKRFAIILDSPLVYDAEQARLGFYGAKWRDDLPAEFVLIPREGYSGDIQRIAIPPQTVMHYVNAYDLPDGRIVVDGVSNDRIMKQDPHGPLEGKLTMNRFTIDPNNGSVEVRVVSDLPQELPRIDDRKFSKQHRFSYSWGIGQESSIIKIDYEMDKVEQYRLEPGTYPSEPIFYPASPDAAEDEGWILSYIGDLRSNTSELAIFDARNLLDGPVARIQIPQRVPVTFHGNFFPD
ncbi:Carotenoid cleavage oxygenase [compost metagenome]|uniref:8'-apo-carotenoid 13,14-cleaving dioxygenase n=1 Tax=Pseudomonas fluorescens TaxID=294 RepID=A0A5E7RMW9_PSEFL|nr:carotenoid oxygenase family protein [Pseudomonas fluorescens]VVP75010.1 8'-apo-carotenoid 13,14-cleaving dioxygenase [Pseudomonas fluorescens]